MTTSSFSPFVNTDPFPVTGVGTVAPLVDYIAFSSTAFPSGGGDNLLFSPYPSTAVTAQLPVFPTDPFPTTDFNLAVEQLGFIPFTPTGITTIGPQITAEFIPNVYPEGTPSPVPVPGIDVNAVVGTPTPINAPQIDFNAQVPQPIAFEVPQVEGNAAVPLPTPINNPQINIAAPVGTPTPVSLPQIDTNSPVEQTAFTPLPEITFGSGISAQAAALPQVNFENIGGINMQTAGGAPQIAFEPNIAQPQAAALPQVSFGNVGGLNNIQAPQLPQVTVDGAGFNALPQAGQLPQINFDNGMNAVNPAMLPSMRNVAGIGSPQPAALPPINTVGRGGAQSDALRGAASPNASSFSSYAIPMPQLFNFQTFF